jgi:hypothetical protein
VNAWDEQVDDVVDEDDSAVLEEALLEETMILEEAVIVVEETTLPVWEPTGDPRVDAALELLVMAEEVPAHEQAEVFADMHDRLRQALTAESE